MGILWPDAWKQIFDYEDQFSSAAMQKRANAHDAKFDLSDKKYQFQAAVDEFKEGYINSVLEALKLPNDMDEGNRKSVRAAVTEYVNAISAEASTSARLYDETLQKNLKRSFEPGALTVNAHAERGQILSECALVTEEDYNVISDKTDQTDEEKKAVARYETQRDALNQLATRCNALTEARVGLFGGMIEAFTGPTPAYQFTPETQKALADLHQTNFQESLKKQLSNKLAHLHQLAAHERSNLNLAVLLTEGTKISAKGKDGDFQSQKQKKDTINNIVQLLKKIQDPTQVPEKVSDLVSAVNQHIITRSGQRIGIQEGAEGQLNFSLQMPAYPWYGRNSYYTSKADHALNDLRIMAEMVKATGAKGIEFKIEQDNPKLKLHMARKAFQAALDAGFEEDQIDIIVDGKRKSRTDLEKENIKTSAQDKDGTDVPFHFVDRASNGPDSSAIFRHTNLMKAELNTLRGTKDKSLRTYHGTKEDVEHQLKEARAETKERERAKAAAEEADKQPTTPTSTPSEDPESTATSTTEAGPESPST